jgi:hypothetical protein
MLGDPDYLPYTSIICSIYGMCTVGSDIEVVTCSSINRFIHVYSYLNIDSNKVTYILLSTV